MLLQDAQILPCSVQGATDITTTAPKALGMTIAGSKEAVGVRETAGLVAEEQPKPSADNVQRILDKDDDEEEQETIHSFPIKDDKVGTVAERCLALHYPILEEYDFAMITPTQISISTSDLGPRFDHIMREA
ncbi:hypothetical protein ACQKWADRAFT_27536 [Trichoderma austrokoningii]